MVVYEKNYRSTLDRNRSERDGILGEYSHYAPHTPSATLSVVVKTQSAKICINLNFSGRGGGVLHQSKFKVPRSA